MMKKGYWIGLLLWLLPAMLCGQEERVYTSLEQVKDPLQVYHLRLRHRRLREVPPEVWRMANLRELDLRGNRITALSDSVGRLAHLQRLELSRNPLTDMPDSLARLTELRELVLWNTYVTSLPPACAALDGTLQLLDLRSCPLTLDDQTRLTQLIPSVKKLWDYACNCSD